MVHAIMYSYYAIRASGNKTPKFIPICITTLQILQMVAGKCEFETSELKTSILGDFGVHLDRTILIEVVES